MSVGRREVLCVGAGRLTPTIERDEMRPRIGSIELERETDVGRRTTQMTIGMISSCKALLVVHEQAAGWRSNVVSRRLEICRPRGG